MNQKAIDSGLTFSPLAKTVRDLHNWWVSDAVPADRREKMATGEDAFQAKEAEVIAAWRAFQK